MTGPQDAVARWDERYADTDYLWDVRPNQFVERHAIDLEPGRAIDLAAGEGRNAVWLAGRGWQVTAVDFSQAGLDKAARLAADRDVAERVDLVRADALLWEPGEPVDLVVIAYLQIPSPQQRVALEHAAAWLRPGGRLIVVAHDRSNIDAGHGGPQDPDVCYDLAGVRAALATLDIEVAEVARRAVDTEDGPSVALDTLVVASRPSG
jgi:SAM-dependent methyltransferase